MTRNIVLQKEYLPYPRQKCRAGCGGGPALHVFGEHLGRHFLPELVPRQLDPTGVCEATGSCGE